MGKLLHLMVLLVVLAGSMASALGVESGGSGGPIDAIPPQITIISPENDSLITESMLSDVTVSEKEYWLVKNGDNQLEIDEPIGPYSQGVVDFIDNDDLSVLKDEIFVVNGGKYKYEQFLHFDKPAVKVISGENNDFFLKVTGNEAFVRYEINFLIAPKSIITDSQGNPTPDGEYLPDFQNAKLTILGKEYTVLHATKPAGNASIKLELMAGHKSDVLLEGESKTFTFDTKEYAVHLISVDGNSVEFEINGELLEIQSDTVYDLDDGTPISANIFWAGEEPVITLFFNAEKIVLQDDIISGFDNIPTHELIINDETIDGAKVVIRGSILTNQEIDTIFINMTAGNDYFVAENEKLSNVIATTGDQKEVLMNGLFDFEYHGLNEEGLPLVYVTGITEETKKGLPLQLSTDENAFCSYDFGEGYQEMEETGETSHLQYLFDLVKGQDYEVSVQCEDEFGNNNTQLVKFHVAGDVIPPQITFKSPQQNSIFSAGMLSNITIYGTEAWKVETEDNVLELEEPMGNVSPVIGGNELTALADNNWLIDGTEYGYNQSLSFPVVTNYFNQKSGVVTYEEDDDDITSHFFVVRDNFPLATYNLAFTSPAPSEIDGDILTDFQGTTLTLFGKEYYVFSAERPSQNSVELTLMNNFVSDFIEKDETKTFSLSDVGYEITPTFMNEEYVQFKINGETTSMLKVGEIYLLPDSITFGVLDIQEDKAKFILGTETSELLDKDITDDMGSKYEMKVNSQIIDGVAVKIKGTDDNIFLSISSLEVKMTTQDDYYVGAGETLLGQPELGEKDLLFTKNWDIIFDGFIGDNTQYPQVYITATVKESNKPALPLEISTDENTVCSYSLGQEYQEMDTTGAKLHSQNLFDLEDGKDYEILIQCVDESDNTNTELLKFYFGEVAEPTKEPPQNPPSNSGGGGSSSSSSKKTDNNKNKEINLIESNSVPEVKKASELVTLLADTPAETASTPSSSNKLTAAIIEIAENGGLVYVAGFVLILFSLVGVEIYRRKN